MDCSPPWGREVLGSYNELTSSLEYPERIRVVSVFETWLCLFFSCQSANFLHFIHWPANFISFHSFQILKYSRWIHFTPPGVTSERRLARSTRRYIGTALRGALYSLSPYCFIIIVYKGVYHRPKLELVCNVGSRLFWNHIETKGTVYSVTTCW